MISLQRIESKANANLSKIYQDYFRGGSERELSSKKNLSAFEALELWPRVLRGKFSDKLAMELLRGHLKYPIIAAPTAFHKLAHPEGEVATARALAKTGSGMVVSMAANTAIETICQAAYEVNANCGIWLQIYIQADRQFTHHIIQRAEKCGCKGIVVTVDSPVFPLRERDLENGFNELPTGLNCPNLEDETGNIRAITFDSQLNWQDIARLRDKIRLPMALKGLLHPMDIPLAIEHGASAVFVSNHGGRQMDGTPATIKALPLLVKAAAGKIPLILDGGIRYGSDILKALAMGASAVAVGRPIVWGLAANGEQGVANVIEYLQTGLMSAIQLCGCRTKRDINPALLEATIE